MFNSKSKSSPIDSLIGAGSSIDGDIRFTGGLRIDGTVRGNIYCEADQPGRLELSERAHVEGEIHVARIVINGAVVGPVYAAEYVELMPKARVTGDVNYKSIEVHVGAIVTGRLIHTDAPEPRVLEFKATTV